MIFFICHICILLSRALYIDTNHLCEIFVRSGFMPVPGRVSVCQVSDILFLIGSGLMLMFIWFAYLSNIMNGFTLNSRN